MNNQKRNSVIHAYILHSVWNVLGRFSQMLVPNIDKYIKKFPHAPLIVVNITFIPARTKRS